MKKLIYIIIIACMCLVSTLTYAASVTPTRYDENDANPNQYTPPEESVRITLPNSDIVGTHKYVFNELGELDSEGTNTLTLVIGKDTTNSYTKVLSWSWDGDATLYSIIVKCQPAFLIFTNMMVKLLIQI